MLEPYDHHATEARWQARWADLGLFKTRGTGERFYCLMMYPYPSGVLHMGHIINYSIGDAIVRYHLMRGKDVLTPMGWDSFGLPAENHAIRTGTPPAVSTRNSINAMRTQLIRAGFGYDWSREIATSHPGYYQWTQWIFLKLFENGLAFRKQAPVNWCSSCQTVLANEQVQDGACERCGTQVEQKDLVQWFFRMSAYAQKLLDGHAQLEGKWPDRVLKMQKDWIGRSEGSRLDFELVAPGSPAHGRKLSVFTTRPDTVYGVTFMSLAPEHPLVPELVRGTPVEKDVLAACRRMRNQDAITRTSEDSEKEGIWTGRHVRNPFDGSLSQLWVANYALMDYGSGAVMAVPAHDQRDFLFARQYGLPIKVVIQPEGETLAPATMKAAHAGDGVQVDSGPFNGIRTRAEAIRKMTEHARDHGFGDFTVHYRLKDWLLSRQRYWGAPIPVVYCERCDIVGVPEKDLPVVLPDDVEFRPQGESPLASAKSFVHTKCPRCGAPARREIDTMDTFVDSSWYFLRYLSPRDRERPFDPEELARWLPVDQYVGGIEHANMHLIYARFLTKALHDLGLIAFDEPFERLFCQGMVQGMAYRCEEHKWLAAEEVDLAKLTCKHCGRQVASEMRAMSKTKKNGASPDEIFERYGADTAHAAILFLGPADQDIVYDETGVQGIHRFLRRFWDAVGEKAPWIEGAPRFAGGPSLPEPWRSLRRKCHDILKRITDTFEGHTFKFNTCISGIMEVLSEIQAAGEPGEPLSRSVLREALELAVQMLGPFAPHIAEEMWRKLGRTEPTLFRVPWPPVDAGALEVAEVEIAVQVNGKVRARVTVRKGLTEAEAVQVARDLAPIRSLLEGKEVVRAVWVPDKLVNIVAR